MQHGVVVIGGGIVGASVALHLADLGAPVTLVDEDRPGYRASALSFGSLTALDAHPASYQLACGSMAAWPRWARRLGPRAGFRRGGEVRWATGPAGGRALTEQVERLERQGYPVRLVREAALRRLLPAAGPLPVSAAAHAPADAQVDPAGAVAACHDALAAAGGRLLLGAPARVLVRDGGVRVHAGGAVLRPAVTVLAAGAASARVAAACGVEVPLVPSPGLLVETAPVPERLTGGVTYLLDEPGPQIHLRQRPDGSVLVGEGSQRHPARDLSQRHAQRLLRQAARLFPALRGVPARCVTVGWRLQTADQLPIVGPVPGLPPLYLALAPGGVTVAPLLGELAAGEVATGVPEPRLSAFRPDRFDRQVTELVQEVEAVFTPGPATGPGGGGRMAHGGGGTPRDAPAGPRAAPPPAAPPGEDRQAETGGRRRWRR